MIKLIILILLFIGIQLHGQQMVNPSSGNSDRSGAIVVSRDTIVCTNSPIGYGDEMEFSSSKENTKSFEKEHNTIWYKIIPKKSCTFSFKLYPNKIEDDYDFMFLECDSICNENSKLKTLRTNISRNNKSIGSKTGMDETGQAQWVGEGPGNSFSKSVKVKAGWVYFLVIDNVYKNGEGHKIIINYSHCKEISIKNDSPKLVLKINDKESHKLVDARVVLIKKNYPEADDTIVNKKGQIIISALDVNYYYDIFVTGDSVLAFKDEFKVYPEDSIISKTINLQRIEPGKKIILDHIYFRGGSAQFLRKSFPAMKNLLFIMKENPNLEIEIQGYVNVPKNTVKKQKEAYYQNLSEARAMAVRDYLIKRGISDNRLTYKGFGYSNMLYPYAKTEEEMQQNRRVEILIKKM